MSTINTYHSINLTKEQTFELIHSIKGLTLTEIDDVLSHSLIERGKLEVSYIIGEKRRLINSSGLLTCVERKPGEINGLNDLGGFGACKRWLANRKEVFLKYYRRHMQEEKESGKLITLERYRIPSPKGILLLGIQGGGKSLLGKALAAEWNLPLIMLDLGRILASRVGESESRMRAAINIAESMQPCIMFIDEIEKGFAGLQSSGMSDGGTTSRVIGYFLTWLQERDSRIFIVATSNNIEDLPPELVRKGRFDEIFFVDLPSEEELTEIWKIHLVNHTLDHLCNDAPLFAKHTSGFSGAEVQSIVIDELYDAYLSQKEITAKNILSRIKKSIPLSRTHHECIQHLRNWARGRCINVSDSTKTENQMEESA